MMGRLERDQGHLFYSFCLVWGLCLRLIGQKKTLDPGSGRIRICPIVCCKQCSHRASIEATLPHRRWV
jgi:hypothetical protein